ncbi:TRAP transporter small permease [Pannonibacter sp. Q-1]|uniref:TRAP transporter small permease protein n=1 Tax=Pannonibacter phragmitetus TaxID=121719 RepID=A0A0L0IZF0_9HYPH|nr:MULTISPECIES: TRAP transporter small permease [Pannonibacter]ALV28687.1 C4-dicarboxylate ABC transporter substrate-binding protein [Pannonibacter phragmitetus]KND18752.1 C4-dicarboxylate ABC transporter substrate-binding protein [Pannonibacter phragmitetus]MBA4204490.1 2,3-diketo-L-gulonate TRAP transporter small permease YiaM [Polymorphum sp.]
MSTCVQKTPIIGERPARSAGLTWFRMGLAGICAVMLTAMMLLTVADVVGRYFLASPVQGATELTEMLLAAVIFIGLPAATLDDDHVTVDMLTARLPWAVERLRRPVVAFASAAILCVIGWRLWAAAAQVGSYGGTTISLQIPLAPLGYLVSIFTGLAALILVAKAIACLLPVQAGRPE